MLSFAKSRLTGKMKNVFFFFIILIIASSSVYGQRIFRPIDPEDPYARYGKSPYSGPPFLHFGTTSYTYKISSSLYNSHLSYVDAAFTSWNNSGPVQFSRIIYGLPLTAQAQNYASWGPAWSYPSWNPNTYVLTPDNGSIVLNSSSNCEWRHDRQDLNASPHVIDVQTMVVHEAGHIMGLAHPLTDSYTHNATAPTMAGGDNEYFDNTLECRSLETEDIYGTQFLQLRFPTLYANLQTALNKAGEIGIGYVYVTTNYNLSSNITIPAGATLIMKSGVILGLNNHSIIINGGTLTGEVDSGIDGLVATLKSGTTIKGFFPSIETAINVASSGQTVYVSGNQTLTGNITVSNGINLTIQSTATINLNGYSIISTGTIVNYGATINGLRAELQANTVLKGLCGTIQAAANNAAQDYEIILEDGNFNENVSISNKSDLRILGGSTSYKHFGQLTLTNCDYFEGLYFGAKSVIINYSDYAILNWIYALGTNQTTYGFYIYNSDVNANDILAYYSQAGVSCYDGTEADIDESWLYSNLRGLEAYNGSNVDISNTYFCGTGLDLKTYNFSSIEAGFCYFNGGTPSVSGSNIQHYGDQSCPVSKTNPDQQTGDNNYVNSTNEDNTAGSEFEKINSAYFDINRRLINALKEKTSFNSEAFCSEYETVIADFKEFIKSNPDSPQAKIALIASARSYRRIDGLRGKSEFADMKNFLTSIIENREFPGLIPQAERLMIDYYKLTDNFTEAIKTADNIIEEYQKDTNYVCSTIYAKGLILAYNLNQPEQAAECFSLILQNYPENGLAALAENELQILGIPADKFAKNTLAIDNLEFNTSSYPNPFNPTTTISYTLPTDELVVLKVYDILGREVTTLVNEEKEAGTYSAIFDASNLASGIYFYTISAGKFHQTKKMLLLR